MIILRITGLFAIASQLPQQQYAYIEYFVKVFRAIAIWYKLTII
ncbi:hypothetical protein [Nostoc sp.]